VLSARWYVDIGNRIVITNALFLGVGDGAFIHIDPLADEIPRRPELHRGSAVCSELVDMDGDGDLDLVTGAPLDGPGGTREQKTYLFFNDGYGTFADRSDLFPHIDGRVLDVGVADFDGDGDQDVVRAEISNWDGGGGGLQFHFNHGSAGFDNLYGPFIGPYATCLDLGDVDLDGDMDILAGHEYTSPFLPDRLFLNDGAAGFTSAPGFPEEAQNTHDVRLVDVNGDTHLDALLIGSEAYLYLGDGNASFTEAPLPFADGFALDLADVDDDGDLDLLLARRVDYLVPDVVTLYRNDGSGAFTPDPQLFPVANDRVDSVALQDVDEDGAPDAFVDGQLYRNDGTGAFVHDASALPRGISVHGASFADVDGDGDVDLVSSGRLWTNITRQLSWGTLPRLGQPLRMAVHGPANGPFAVAFAPNPAILAGARAGVHQYDPALLRIVKTGRLRADGTASFVKNVPDDPALAGVSLFWQAIVGNPARFTNVEWTTLLDL